MLVEATVVSPVRALAWYAGGGGAAPPLFICGFDEESALRASHLRESWVGLRDVGGELLAGLHPPPFVPVDLRGLGIEAPPTASGVCPTMPVLLIITGEGKAGRSGASISTLPLGSASAGSAGKLE